MEAECNQMRSDVVGMKAQHQQLKEQIQRITQGRQAAIQRWGGTPAVIGIP